VLCGAVAEDALMARYTVALARERQRRYAAAVSFRVTAAMLVVLTLASVTIAILDSELSNNEIVGCVLFALVCAYALWREWRERGNIHRPSKSTENTYGA
jgi:small neutral amino acid transporter SnatA (MarC family)